MFDDNPALRIMSFIGPCPEPCLNTKPVLEKECVHCVKFGLLSQLKERVGATSGLVICSLSQTIDADH